MFVNYRHIKDKFRAIYIFGMILLSNSFLAVGQEKITIEYTPIGHFESEYSPETGAPRQGILFPESEARIVIYDEYQAGLQTLSLFEYIIVIYHFSLTESWDSTVNPPAANHLHNFGVFSTRSPKRPNPIGFSVIKLDKIKDGVLYVSGTDAFDGTPVLDIKPYLPSIDKVESIQNSLIELELGHHDELFINDTIFYK